MGAFSRKRLRERFITFASAVANVILGGRMYLRFKVDQIGPGGCSALQGRMQCTARADAVHCKGGCSALRGRLQCTASEMGNTGTEIVSPILDKRKGRKDTPHMGHSSPLIYLLSREYPCGWSSGLHPESAISVMKEPMDKGQGVHTAPWKRFSA